MWHVPGVKGAIRFFDCATTYLGLGLGPPISDLPLTSIRSTPKGTNGAFSPRKPKPNPALVYLITIEDRTNGGRSGLCPLPFAGVSPGVYICRMEDGAPPFATETGRFNRTQHLPFFRLGPKRDCSSCYRSHKKNRKKSVLQSLLSEILPPLQDVSDRQWRQPTPLIKSILLKKTYPLTWLPQEPLATPHHDRQVAVSTAGHLRLVKEAFSASTALRNKFLRLFRQRKSITRLQ
jgi:hypothetical protein